jgi:hypothetical protein
MDAEGGERLYRSCARGGTPWTRSGSCEPCLPARGPRPSRRRRREVRLLCWVGQLGVVGELAELEGVGVGGGQGKWRGGERRRGQARRGFGVSAGGGRGRREPVGLGLRRGQNFLPLQNKYLGGTAACGRRIPTRRPRIGWGEIPRPAGGFPN